MTADQHTVTLPHPARTGPKTVGTCECGWTVSYGWGGHRDAAGKACGHIVEAGHAQAITTQNVTGEITVMEGLSL